MIKPNHRIQQARKDGGTLIGWVLRFLQKLPSSKKAFLQLTGTLFSLAIIILLTRALGERKSSADIIATVLIPLAILLLVATGSWLRKWIDQRYGPSKRRERLLLQLVDTAATHHSDVTSEITLRSFTPKAKGLYAFPKPNDEDGLVTEATKLNCAAFSGSAYADSFERKYRRNGSHQRQNPRSLMLVAYKRTRADVTNNDLYIGFTHLIPISESTYLNYINGKINDNDFSAALVCRPTEIAYAIIIFSIGIDRYKLKQIIKDRNLNILDRFLSKIGLPPFRIGDMYEAEFNLWIGLWYHLKELLNTQTFYNSPVVLVAQSLNSKVAQVLKSIGFEQLEGLSADGEYLFQLKVWSR